MKRIFFLFLTFVSLSAGAQTDLQTRIKTIVDEGKRLYRSEMASWYGTDLFLVNYKSRTNVGGYFSFTTKEDVSKCIFFSKAEKPKVIGTISFDKTFNPELAKIDLNEREFTAIENDLYVLRKVALATINTDTLFKRYSNTDLNLIPLVYNNEKKVYVLTGPKQGGAVILGNDYLMTFDSNNQLIARKPLHKNIIPVPYAGKQSDGTEIVSTIHSHLPETGDLITSTDICTLMLYEKFAKWKSHKVVSQKYLSTWDCAKDELTVVEMGAVEKMLKEQENANPAKQK
ncbi:MAG: hypothetical protein KA172_10885 [Paludibacter sp.]|nr:hypothetical protein [Paludibacter sp.]